MKKPMSALALTLLFFSGLVSAQTQTTTREGIFNKLFGPGPLIEGHAKLENGDCLKCHDTGQGVPDSKCLDCHKEIRRDVDMKKGYHGLAKGTCIQCHSDHKGREYDSTKVDQKTFDHNLTGYKLVGEHAKLKCTDCHKETRRDKPIRQKDTRYFGKQTSCVSCHKKDDVHFFKDQYAKKDCNTCHGETSWKENINFDHKRDAKFELVGSHAKLACAECHIVDEKNKTSKYKWPDLKKQDCLACHENVHGKNLSAKFQNGKCLDCHTAPQVDWKIPKFNHDITNYKLRGKHAEIKCTDCHKQDAARAAQSTKFYKWTGLKSDCLTCHKDYHVFGKGSPKPKLTKFKSLNQCLNCHTEKNWEETQNFDHNKDTRYPITGKHKEVSCRECHVTEPAKSPTKTAVGRYHWNQLPSKTCETCHASPHKKTFSKEFLAKKCTECHVTDDWFRKPGGAAFNHDETRFKLTGRHLTLDCAKCHTGEGKNKIYKFKSFEKNFCVDCHQTPHKDQFNPKFVEQACNTCHTTKDFKGLLKFDHDKTKFKIEGAHRELACKDCHTETSKGVYGPEKKPVTWHKFLFKDLDEKSCRTCHADYHNGQLSQKCTDCHTQKEWKNPSFDHNKQSKFKLLGKHQDLKCAECHTSKDGKVMTFGPKKEKYRVVKYKPIATDCNSCHKSDDVHKGSFGIDCNRCHVERGWKVAKDFHRNFALKGQHFTLNCNECHVDSRRLAGTGQNCIFCHQKDDVHRGTLPNCNDCHRQQLWEQTKFRHSMTYPLRGAHVSLDCFQCHKNNVYQGTPNTCVGCHAADALRATSRLHALPADQDCMQCHNGFTFGL